MVQCPSGGKIESFEFASFGNPTGMCGSYQPGSCHQSDVFEILDATCKGKNSCKIDVSAETFKHTCSETQLTGTAELRVQIACSGSCEEDSFTSFHQILYFRSGCGACGVFC